MKIFYTTLLLEFIFLANSTLVHFPNQNTEAQRVKELDEYWSSASRAIKAGDFEGMKATYHEDAVLVKSDTTISIAEAFQSRWRKEIMEVKAGRLKNAVDFRFSKRIGNHITAKEIGIFSYSSVEAATGKVLTEAFVHFEALLVKVDEKWLMIMEYQKEEATAAEWKALK